MAFVFDHVTRLGLGAMSPTGPVWELAQPKGFLSGGTGGDCFPACYFNHSWQLWRRITLQSKPKWVWGGVERFERSFFYLQDERREVWSVRAQIRYCLQFVVVQLSVCVREKETVKKNSLGSDKVCSENPAFTLESAENTRHTYTSLRCCSLENNALSSTCNLLWLRSLWREKKRQKLKEKYTPWSVFLSCSHLGLHGKHNYIHIFCVMALKRCEQRKWIQGTSL